MSVSSRRSARCAPACAHSLAAPAAVGAGIVAVGPEGGWSDYELRMFEAAGFRRVSLGPRVLRTDTAVVALLSLLTLPQPR